MSWSFYKLPCAIAGRRDLTAADKVVCAVLAYRIGNNGYCWPGIRTLAKDTGLNVSTIIVSVRRLEDKGLLLVQRRGSGRSNQYRLVVGESAGAVQALGKSKRSENPNSGDGESQAQAHAKGNHNEIDQFNQTSDSVRLAQLLLDEIRRQKPDYKKPDLKSWVKHIDLMIRLDNRKPERIAQVIYWCQADTGNGTGFGWANNVLSTATLREKFDRLELDMAKRPGQQAVVTPPERGADGLTPRERALKKELQK